MSQSILSPATRTIIQLIIGLMVFQKLAQAADSRPLTFETRMVITDLDNRPIPRVDGRLILGEDAAWKTARSGTRFETDAEGQCVIKMEVRLGVGARKRPTNFLDSLFSGKETTDELKIAVELIYAGEPLLYVAEVHRFRSDGSALLGEVAVFARDAHGDFTIRVPRDKHGGWLLPQFRGLAVTTPGHEIAGFLYHPDENDPSGKTWILTCRFKRSPEPVLR